MNFAHSSKKNNVHPLRLVKDALVFKVRAKTESPVNGRMATLPR
jgi:hypothetical protein